jgi:hypothetical protein
MSKKVKLEVGDLVRCPVSLETGEMFGTCQELGIVVNVHAEKSEIEVLYVASERYNTILSRWYENEVELVNKKNGHHM